MILRANIRSNGAQLADYLVSLKDNSNIQILEVDGRDDASPEYLLETIMSMQLNSELTKSNKSFFNVQINPAYGEDTAMTREDWYKAADLLAVETGFENQRRVIVLHTKKGRTHAHVVWERYNHDTGRMVDNKHSRLKVDRARPKIEQALQHQNTPYRNPQRLELKEAVTQIWNRTQHGQEFLKEIRKAGYMVASGTGNRPFMIVDENGRSFDLVRQIQGARTKDVRARLRNEKLITDKEAIELMRQNKGNSGKEGKTKQAAGLETTNKKVAEFKATGDSLIKKAPEPTTNTHTNNIAIDFSATQQDIIATTNIRRDKLKAEIAMNLMLSNAKTVFEDDSKKAIAKNNQVMLDYLKEKDEKLLREEELRRNEELYKEKDLRKQKQRGFER